MRKPLIAAAVLAAVPAAIAQMPTTPPGAPDARRVTGGTYNVDPNHTLIGWRLNHLGFNDYFGIFGDSTGTLTLDPKNPRAAKVDITIPVGKVTTANAALTAHLLRPGKDGGKPDFFGANPADARFVSRAVTVNGTKALITGDLTLNGVTKPVRLDAEFTGAGTGFAMQGPGKETVGFHATSKIMRSQFGITQGVPLVGDEVKLDITVAFEKQ